MSDIKKLPENVNEVVAQLSDSTKDLLVACDFLKLTAYSLYAHTKPTLLIAKKHIGFAPFNELAKAILGRYEDDITKIFGKLNSKEAILVSLFRNTSVDRIQERLDNIAKQQSFLSFYGNCLYSSEALALFCKDQKGVSKEYAKALSNFCDSYINLMHVINIGMDNVIDGDTFDEYYSVGVVMSEETVSVLTGFRDMMQILKEQATPDKAETAKSAKSAKPAKKAIKVPNASKAVH